MYTNEHCNLFSSWSSGRQHCDAVSPESRGTRSHRPAVDQTVSQIFLVTSLSGWNNYFLFRFISYATWIVFVLVQLPPGNLQVFAMRNFPFTIYIFYINECQNRRRHRWTRSCGTQIQPTTTTTTTTNYYHYNNKNTILITTSHSHQPNTKHQFSFPKDYRLRVADNESGADSKSNWTKTNNTNKNHDPYPVE